LTEDAPGYEDDVLFAEGVGFTDIIKRATARSQALRPDEFAHGRAQLLRKLNEADAPLVIFTYKRSAEVLFGGFRRRASAGPARRLPAPAGPPADSCLGQWLSGKHPTATAQSSTRAATAPSHGRERRGSGVSTLIVN
jgi:hypothetical protein